MDKENFFTKMLATLRKSVSEIAPGRSNTIIFAIFGFLAALLLLSIGFWRMLVICLFVFAGAAIGQQLDGNPTILKWLRDLFSDKD